MNDFFFCVFVFVVFDFWSINSEEITFCAERGHRGLNVNWSPLNFADSEATSTLLLNWISARLSWGWAFWVVWAEGRKIAREIAKPRFREIQMRIGRNRDGNCKRSTHPGNGQTETKFELFALDIWGEILSIWFHDFSTNRRSFSFRIRNVFLYKFFYCINSVCMFAYILFFECLFQSGIGFLVGICHSLSNSETNWRYV